jgi:hypothetical protein
VIQTLNEFYSISSPSLETIILKLIVKNKNAYKNTNRYKPILGMNDTAHINGYLNNWFKGVLR